jgi:hypothetical protein
MNFNSTLIASALALASTASMGADATQFPQEAGTLTRSQVVAELARARANGELDNHGDSYGTIKATPATPTGARTRESVVAELKSAQSRGQLAASGDSYGSFTPAEIKSVLTRAEVRAQVSERGHSRGNYKDYAGG